MFSGKAEKVSADLEHAEQVMLEHEKQHFSDKHTKQPKDKEGDKAETGHEKYSSLYTSFDVLKSHEEYLLSHKVLCVATTAGTQCWTRNIVLRCVTKMMSFVVLIMSVNNIFTFYKTHCMLRLTTL